jgi:hypothetical protein
MFFENSYEWDNAYNEEALINSVSKKLFGDETAMSKPLRDAIRMRLSKFDRWWSPGDPNFEGKQNDLYLRNVRSVDAIFLSLISPEFALQQ